MSLDLTAIEQRASRYLTTRDHVDRAYEIHDLTVVAAASAEDVPTLVVEVKRLDAGTRTAMRWMVTEYVRCLSLANTAVAELVADTNRGRADAYREAVNELTRQFGTERVNWEMLRYRAAGQPHGCGRCPYCGGIGQFDKGCTYFDMLFGPAAAGGAG